MKTARLLLAFSSALVFGALVPSCAAPVPACSVATCSGCCDGTTCVQPTTAAQCGASGAACIACPAGNACDLGACRLLSGSGGGGGSATGGGTATGGGAATGGGTASGGGTATGGGSATGGGTATGGGSGTGGGSATGGGSGTGGGTATFDAGIITLDDGGMAVPPTIALTFQASCGTVTRCAGNEVGAWVYSAGCVEDSAFTRISGLLTQVGCTSTVSNKRGSIAGSVLFDGTNVTRTVVGAVNFTLTANGTVCLSQCSSIPGYFPAGIMGSCAVSGSSCVCNLGIDIGEAGTQTYTWANGGLSLGSGETFDACIMGSNLQFRETTQNALPAVFSLTK